MIEHRQLGRTGITVPAIGFGCGGNARLMVEDDEELRIETIRVALECGINYFDTAAAYGDGRSEINLGRALRALGASPIISDKVNLQLEDLTDPRSAVLRHFDAGMERLGRDRVDALMLHNRVFDRVEPGAASGIGAQLTLDQMFARNGVVAAFQELVSSKRVTCVGFTALGGDAGALCELIDSGVFGAMNASFNIVNPSAMVPVSAAFGDRNFAQVIPKASAAGLGVMAIQVFASGLLSRGGPIEGRDRAAVTVAEQSGDKLPGVALRYVLSKPEVSVAILGLSEPRHVTDAVEAMERGPLEPSVIAAIEEVHQR